jgi:uncharacterized protein Usg
LGIKFPYMVIPEQTQKRQHLKILKRSLEPSVHPSLVTHKHVLSKTK